MCTPGQPKNYKKTTQKNTPRKKRPKTVFFGKTMKIRLQMKPKGHARNPRKALTWLFANGTPAYANGPPPYPNGPPPYANGPPPHGLQGALHRFLVGSPDRNCG